MLPVVPKIIERKFALRLLMLLLLSVYLFPDSGSAQNQAGKLGLEINRLKLGVFTGPYKGRRQMPDGNYKQGIAFSGQAYYPIQLAADYQKNFTDTTGISDEYNNRVFLVRPSAIFYITDQGSMLFGQAIQFSFLITRSVYLEYQLAGVYVEANQAGAPDLYDGFHLQHFISVSKPLSRHFSIVLGIDHVSGAGLKTGTASNQDGIQFGLKWNL